MGNYNTKSYSISNSSNQSGISGKNKMNPRNRVLQHLGCNKIYKRRSKDKPELVKSLSCVLAKDTCEVNHNRYSSGNCDISESTDTYVNGDSSPNHYDVIQSQSNNQYLDSLSHDTICDNFGTSLPDQANSQDRLPTISRKHPRLSEISINSDDLMLSTDVNLDQADDDVSKDYNANEKDDPFITSLNDINPKMDDESFGQICAEDSERNDIVYFDSSRESSVSLQRKIGQRVQSRRPHSFSTPLRTDSKIKPRRSSNLSTVDSIDLAWTWMSASESANIVQEISNLKLMLLKTRRLLLDDFNNDQINNGSLLSENDPNVFSEPGTPIYYNDQNKLPNIDPNNQPSKCWSNMDKDALIQELQEVSKRNYLLQCQLNDKTRVIELLQDNKRRFQRPLARTDPIISRIARSSTFDSSIMMNPLSPTTDNSSFPNTFSTDDKIMKSELKNIDSGLYQSSSSTDSFLYQN